MYASDRSDFFLALTNPGGMATSQTFPVPAPSLTNPEAIPPGNGVIATGDGVLNIGTAKGIGNIQCARSVRLVPFGSGGAGTTFQMSIYAWDSTTGFQWASPNVWADRVWMPLLIGQYSVTLGTTMGPVSGEIDPDYNFAQTITQTFAHTDPTGGQLEGSAVFSPGNNQIGHILQRVFGCRLLQVIFQLGTATGANCLWKRY
jgi:hypothetical protein